MTLVKALNEHLRLPGETHPQFAAQLKQLTDADRAWFIDAFAREGVTIATTPQE